MYDAETTLVAEEPLSSVAYVYDGSLEGLLSAIFASYENHELPEDLCIERNLQLRFGQSARYIATDFDRAQRVRRGIVRQAGSRAFGAIALAAASEDPRAGGVIMRFVRHVMAARPSKRVLDDLSNPIVSDLVALETRTSNEMEKMRQFVRFKHMEGGVWFARCNPNASVVPLVMPHFVRRFNVQPFVIYDERHKMAGVYDGLDWMLVNNPDIALPKEAADEAYYEGLWQRFYDSVSIEARYNPELRRQFMPVRLWKDLPELGPRR